MLERVGKERSEGRAQEKNLYLLRKGQQCPPQFPKLPSGVLKIAVYIKKLFQKKPTTSAPQSCDKHSKNSNTQPSSPKKKQPGMQACPYS